MCREMLTYGSMAQVIHSNPHPSMAVMTHICELTQADVRAKNKVLELDHAKLSETYKALSTSVVDCLQMIGKAVQHGDLHAREVDNSVFCNSF